MESQEKSRECKQISDNVHTRGVVLAKKFRFFSKNVHITVTLGDYYIITIKKDYESKICFFIKFPS